MTSKRKDLEQRIRRLERRHRLFQILLMLACGFGLMALKTDDASLRARSFELVSDEGSVRAALRLDEGNPAFVLHDVDGVERLRLFHEADATGLYILDVENTPRVGIAQFSHGGGGVALHGPKSKGAAVLYLREKGSLRFFDPDGNVTTQVPPSTARNKEK